MSSVRVAVRIRPFNTREKEMNSVVCLDMQGVNTIIKNPETKEPKTFAFDFSYWSHDGFKEGPDGELIPLNDKYATQQKVFQDLGQDVLTSAYDGYNSTLFAYGQTGAGKSFSMVGYGVNKGIIPMVCSEMFKTVEKGEGGKKYQVTTTMLEIYNECIRDLLNPAVNVPGGLKVRSKPGIGVYVENLTPVAVSNYKEIETRMDEGTAARTVASTKMNATSSRAHTVFGINFTCIVEMDGGAKSETTARMNLVDLAGSERAESTGATGDRLKEGCAINASLSALGNVITALADIAMGKKKVFVPYRNSALTRLLQDALGGNSRTIMVAALSPADVNYDETLGTLRYADRCIDPDTLLALASGKTKRAGDVVHGDVLVGESDPVTVIEPPTLGSSDLMYSIVHADGTELKVTPWHLVTLRVNTAPVVCYRPAGSESELASIAIRWVDPRTGVEKYTNWRTCRLESDSAAHDVVVEEGVADSRSTLVGASMQDLHSKMWSLFYEAKATSGTAESEALLPGDLFEMTATDLEKVWSRLRNIVTAHRVTLNSVPSEVVDSEAFSLMPTAQVSASIEAVSRNSLLTVGADGEWRRVVGGDEAKVVLMLDNAGNDRARTFTNLSSALAHAGVPLTAGVIVGKLNPICGETLEIDSREPQYHAVCKASMEMVLRDVGCTTVVACGRDNAYHWRRVHLCSGVSRVVHGFSSAGQEFTRFTYTPVSEGESNREVTVWYSPDPCLDCHWTRVVLAISAAIGVQKDASDIEGWSKLPIASVTKLERENQPYVTLEVDGNHRYALATGVLTHNCKKIKNAVVKMENPTDKIIRQLKEENARLLALLSGAGIAAPVSGDGAGGEGGGDGAAGGADVEAIRAQIMAENEAKLKEQMAENEKIINEMKKSWEEKLKDSAAIVTNSMGDSGAVHARNATETKIPYLINLHEDPQLSECVIYVFKRGITRIGRKNPDVPQDVNLSGLNILAEHALVTNEDGKVVIESLNKSKTFVNGDIVAAPTELHTGDRVILGNNFVFRYTNPEEPDARETKPVKEREWAEAMDEFSTKQGLRLQQSLGGEMGRLEQEESQKRKELEEKLAAMEEAMRREREQARRLMEEQKLAFSKRIEAGEKLTDDERAAMSSMESAFANKERNLEEEMVKRREISEKIIQEQMKRKRQTKKIEERLAKLIPLINEANSMAEELRKPVRFEARLSVKSNNVNLSTLDELRNLKMIDVTIRVTSLENGNVWNWNHIKFDSRLFMMKDIYQEYMDFGPRDIPKSKDPFWDPPEAVEIGKAYVYLKALSQLVEIESDFAIVDYKGDEQGQLSVSIFPEGPNGEDLDYLASSEELIGKPLTLLVRIPQAKGIPTKFNNDVFVNFAFMDQVKETEACEVKTTDPKWKFQTRFKFDSVTEELRQYLLKEAAVFEVRGFSDPQVTQAAAAAAEAKESASSSSSVIICAQCAEKPACDHCQDCSLDFCDGCFKLLHKSAKKSGHVKVALAPAGTAASVSKCQQCDEKVSEFHCVDCEKNYCTGCNDLLHKSAKRQSHQRNPLSAAPSLQHTFDASQPEHVDRCMQCEEKNADYSCVECTKLLCEGCNALLHKSAQRQEHTRIPIGGNEGPGKCEQCDEGSALVKCEECQKKLCDNCNSMLHRSAKRATHTRVNL